MMDKSKVRIRYGRLTNRAPKNTLITVKVDDVVYFGIARCNVKMDVFHKEIGKYIALQRADMVASDTVLDYDLVGNLKVHKSGLRGCVPVENAKDILDHFRNIDEYCLEN